MPYLIENPQASHGKTYELRSGLNTIGRELDNSIVVSHKSLSRYHAQIALSPESAVLTDLGSLNGTYVNETKVGQCELDDGDLVRFGSVVFTFTQAAEAPSSKFVGEDALDLSIVRKCSPERTRVELRDLLNQERPKHPGTVLKLKQQDTEQRALDKLKILLEVSKQLSSPEEPNKLLSKILDLLFEIMAVDRAVILLVNEETGELEEKAVKSSTEISKDEPFYSRSIINFVYEHGDAILVSDARSDRRFTESHSILVQAIHSSMCVPLKPRDTTIGVLYADNLSMIDVYGEEDLEFLTGLVNQAAVALENAKLYEQIKTEAVVRTKLERFFPEAVSKKLKEEGSLEIIDTEVTALFADISRFTEMSSRMEPRQIVEMLNEYFQVMVEEIVFEYEGTLEKYIGDALLAVWGAPYQQADDVERAVQAAVAMQQAVIRLNQRWQKQRNQQIQIHIGLNTGTVAAGNIGSPKLFQYATIGDTTNVTSRICSAAKAGEILLSQSTFDQLGACDLPLEKIPPVKVKGKDEPLQLYRLLWNA